MRKIKPWLASVGVLLAVLAGSVYGKEVRNELTTAGFVPGKIFNLANSSRFSLHGEADKDNKAVFDIGQYRIVADQSVNVIVDNDNSTLKMINTSSNNKEVKLFINISHLLQELNEEKDCLFCSTVFKCEGLKEGNGLTIYLAEGLAEGEKGVRHRIKKNFYNKKDSINYNVTTEITKDDISHFRSKLTSKTSKTSSNKPTIYIKAKFPIPAGKTLAMEEFVKVGIWENYTSDWHNGVECSFLPEAVNNNKESKFIGFTLIPSDYYGKRLTSKPKDGFSIEGMSAAFYWLRGDDATTNIKCQYQPVNIEMQDDSFSYQVPDCEASSSDNRKLVIAYSKNVRRFYQDKDYAKQVVSVSDPEILEDQAQVNIPDARSERQKKQKKQKKNRSQHGLL